jgi:hypothetical protein
MIVTTETSADAAAVRPLTIEIPEAEIEGLRARIAATRWLETETVADQSQGVQLATIQALARYWATDYDFRRFESRLNALPQFMTEIDGLDIHFIHVTSPHENALPLIITHGWPGSVIEMLGVVGPLTDPTAHGGDAEDAFHLVIPSIPARATGTIREAGTRGALPGTRLASPHHPAVDRRRRHPEAGSCPLLRHAALDRLDDPPTTSRSEPDATVNRHPGPPLSRELRKTHSLRTGPDAFSDVHQVVRQVI